jgi:hypothetical protein
MIDDHRLKSKFGTDSISSVLHHVIWLKNHTENCLQV